MSWDAVAVRNVNRPSSNQVVCPGGHEKCPDQTTCCLMQSGKYGCCPYPQVPSASQLEFRTNVCYLARDGDVVCVI